MYGILVLVIVALPATTIQELRFPHFPWRTALDEGSTAKEPQNALCELPPQPHRGGYMVENEPDAKPGDLFQNVSLVKYELDTTSSSTAQIVITAFTCEAGEWYMSIFRIQNEDLFFNTSWCPSLCAWYKDNMTVVPPPKNTYNTIRENQGPSKSCVLPPYPAGGGYYVKDQPSAKPGDVYQHLVTVHVYEPLRDGEIYSIKNIVCNNGKWFTKIRNFESNMLPFPVDKLCTLLCTTSPMEMLNVSEYSEVKEEESQVTEESKSIGSCKLPPYPQDGDYTVVNRPDAVPGEAFDAAQLVYSCHRNKNIVGSKSIFCVDGVWSDEPPKCISCGSIPSTMEASVSEEAALRQQLPWHASVYAKDHTPYEQMCSGSIIATNLIVTDNMMQEARGGHQKLIQDLLLAAHCFWRKGRGLQPASRFSIAAGKVYRSWDDHRDSAAQKSDVSEIRVSRKFRDSLNTFKDDIALLVLMTPFVYDNYVSPVCVDFDVGFDGRQLMHGNYGQVASWGPTGAGADESSILRIGWMPYVGRDECVAGAPPDLREYITSDKMCAGDGGARLCARDGGAGLVFRSQHEELSNGSFYLRGIASVAVTSSDLCSAHSVNIFTHVLQHEAFLKENLGSALW